MSIRELDEDDFIHGPRLDPQVPTEPPARLLTRVCRRFGVTMSELLGQSHRQHIVRARHSAYWLLRQQGLSYPSIGHIMGYRDHQTVINGVRKVDKLRAASSALDQTLRELSEVA